MSKFIVRDGLNERVVKFLELSQAMCDSYMRERFPTLPLFMLIIAGGTKYLKIQSEEWRGSADKPEKGHSAWCFIDVTNGDILKPESWKKPAKHARGNVFDDDYGLSCVGPYGPSYMTHSRELLPPLCKPQVPNAETTKQAS